MPIIGLPPEGPKDRDRRTAWVVLVALVALTILFIAIALQQGGHP